MRISVVVCTYNRCGSLRDTLQALKRQELPEGTSLEVLVVDNNSKDRTPQVVEQEAKDSRWPIRYLFEPRQGQCHARNRGIREAAAEIVAFTDDDVIPEPNWAAALHEAFVRHGADVAGGRIAPLWLTTPPQQLLHPSLQHFCWGVWALLDRGPEDIVAKTPDRNFLYGGNLAFRKPILEEAGAFRTDLGVQGILPLRGDDTELLERLFTAGKKIVYTPKATVRHKVPADRMRMAYIRRWRFFGGFSTMRLSAREARRTPPWFIRECAENALKALRAYMRRDATAGIHSELLFWEQLGRIAGALTAR